MGWATLPPSCVNWARLRGFCDDASASAVGMLKRFAANRAQTTTCLNEDIAWLWQKGLRVSYGEWS